KGTHRLALEVRQGSASGACASRRRTGTSASTLTVAATNVDPWSWRRGYPAPLPAPPASWYPSPHRQRMTAGGENPAGRAVAALRALVAVTVWGASFAATKRLLAELSPESVLFARTVLGTLLVGAGLVLGGRWRPIPARDWPALLVLAVVGLVLTQVLQAHALERSTSANTAWLVALNPVVTALLAAWLLGERLAGKMAGLALAFGGAGLVVSGGAPGATALGLRALPRGRPTPPRTGGRPGHAQSTRRRRAP